MLYRASISIPSQVPVGTYTAETFLIDNGRVLAAGSYACLRKDLPSGTGIVDHSRAALFPALVNAHTHLELSAFKGAMVFPRTGFPDWLETLFSLRAGIGPDAH